jgi:hypothetical protein
MVPFTNGSGSKPSRCPTKNKSFFSKFFCLSLFEGTFTSFFKDKKSQKKVTNSRNQVSASYLCLMIVGFGADPYLVLMNPEPGGPNRTDPDPQHCSVEKVPLH